jgi:hypothetical protein
VDQSTSDNSSAIACDAIAVDALIFEQDFQYLPAAFARARKLTAGVMEGLLGHTCQLS